jgi:hypothetical protein
VCVSVRAGSPPTRTAGLQHITLEVAAEQAVVEDGVNILRQGKLALAIFPDCPEPLLSVDHLVQYAILALDASPIEVRVQNRARPTRECETTT